MFKATSKPIVLVSAAILVASSALAAKPISMLTKTETSGLTAEVGSELDESSLSAANVADLRLGATPNRALRQALNVQAEVQAIEIFLKSGPAANGDLTVITTGDRR